MLKPHDGEPVTRGTMARTALGRPLFTVQIYVADGWLIDCGPPATGGEIVRLAREQNLHLQSLSWPLRRAWNLIVG